VNTIAFAAGVLVAALALPAAAQTIASIQVEPAQAKVGEPVKITVVFENADLPNCNVRLHFGDGTNRDHKVNQAKDVPLVRTHTYTKAGKYTVKAEGKTALPMLKCTGANQSALVEVVASTSADAKPAASCPAGWTLDANSVDSTTGAFTCSAKPGATLPMARLDCPGALSYFENKTRAQLGCRP
jgi:hypothetical protein